MMNPDEIKELIEKLELDGVETVKIHLAMGIYGNPSKKQVENWLEGKTAEVNHLHKERELDILDRGNKLSETNNLISWIALGVAFISLIISFLVAIYK